MIPPAWEERAPRAAPRPAGGAIVVFARAPRPGQVKTRMTPPLSPACAAELYAALLEDVLAATAEIARELALAPIVAVYPPEARREIARAAPACFRAVPQRGTDLGRRMAWAALEAAASGAEPILLRGSDSPLLDARAVAAAIEALSEADLSICPDRDGGYSLVGLRRPVPGLFSHPMGTRTALEETLAGAAALGLRASLGEPGFDLDTVADLRRLAAAREAGAARLCPATLAYLDAHDLWRLAGGGGG